MNRNVLLTLAVFLLLITPKTWFTRPVSADSDVIRVPRDYPLIQWAINAAKPGDTILVSGYQREWVIVNKTVNLIGESVGAGVDRITIEADGVNLIGFNGLGNVDIGGNGERIINTTIHGGITIHGDDNIVKGNKIIIEADTGVGIHFYRQTGQTNYPSHNLIDNNLVTTLGAYKLRTGIYIQEGNDNLFYNNTIHRSYWGLRIELGLAKGNILYHNNFVNNFEPIWEPWLSYENDVNNNYWDKTPNIPDLVVLGHPWDKIPPKANALVSYDQDRRNPVINGTVVEDTEVWMHGRDSSDNYFITHYAWDFGDGTNETGKGVDPWYAMWETSHIYSEPGTYSITLTVWDLGENNDTVSTTIIVIRDTDGDGTADIDDSDDDGDGVIDEEDVFPLDASEWLDTDGDGIGNNADPDDDDDGIPDIWETKYGLNPLDPADASFDSDNDGLTNLEEYQGGTNPKVSNISVGWEKYLWWILGIIALTGITIGTILFRRHKVSKTE